MRSVTVSTSIDLEERGVRTHVRHTNRVSLPTPLHRTIWWTSAQSVLRLQLRDLRRELER